MAAKTAKAQYVIANMLRGRSDSEQSRRKTVILIIPLTCCCVSCRSCDVYMVLPMTSVSKEKTEKRAISMNYIFSDIQG